VDEWDSGVAARIVDHTVHRVKRIKGATTLSALFNIDNGTPCLTGEYRISPRPEFF